MHPLIRLLSLLALLAPTMATAQETPAATPPPLIQLLGSTAQIHPGDVWTVAAVLTAPEAARYEMGVVFDTRLALLEEPRTSKPAACPEPGYCQVELAAGEAFTITARLQAAPIFSTSTKLYAAAWGGSWSEQAGGVRVSGAAGLERAPATILAFPLLELAAGAGDVLDPPPPGADSGAEQ